MIEIKRGIVIKINKKDAENIDKGLVFSGYHDVEMLKVIKEDFDEIITKEDKMRIEVIVYTSKIPNLIVSKNYMVKLEVVE